jgi:2-C-methyl-D-erythritol 4-phosphate cytidylyltransferase
VRFAADVPKQFADLDGMPMLMRSVQKFAGADDLSGITVVVPSMWLQRAKKIVNMPDIQVIEGGKTRQQSVFNGLRSIKDKADDTDIVMIHDAARPYVTANLIADTYEAARVHGAAVPCITVSDTVKRAFVRNGVNRVRETIDRDSLYLTQTPQAFTFGAIYHAHLKAKIDGYEATDDSALLERMGKYPIITKGDPRNIKVTVVSDTYK